MKSLSNFLHKLYRGAVEKPTTEFKDWALNEAKSLIPFDSCVWGSGSWFNDSPTIHTVHLHQLGNDFVPSWLQHQHEDRLARDMLLKINYTFNVDCSVEYANTAIYDQHCVKFGIRHVVATGTIDEDTLLFNTMVLYRPDMSRPFSEEERALKEVLFPHLIEAARTNWLTNLPHLFSQKQKSSFNSIAASDSAGILQVAMPSFVEVCRQEWAGWKGPALPSSIAEAMREKSSKYIGENIVLNIFPIGDIQLLRARSKVPADDLSVREFEVAQHFANGMDHKSIALDLSISPSTIRSHLNNVYLKLGVNNKASLVSELGRLKN